MVYLKKFLDLGVLIMTTGILYVLHGRREKIVPANLALIQDLQERYAVPQSIGFLEGDQQTLEASVEKLRPQVTHLIVVPILIFAATHVRWDLPRRLQACCGTKITFELTPPLGLTQAVYEFLQQQLQQGLRQRPTATPVLVAHGTGHFSEPLAQLESIAQRLSTALQTSVLCGNYIGAAKVPEVLAQQATPLLVQPLFLTDGRIVHKIQQAILKDHPQSTFLPTLEDQPALKAAIAERIDAIL